MKCLSVCEPWAFMIVHGPKAIENRSWPTSYRGEILIHASKSRNYLAEPDERDHWPAAYGVPYPADSQLTFGAIIGRAVLVGCERYERLTGAWAASPFAEGDWCWLLADRQALPAPIPYRGERGLFDVPESVLAGAAPVVPASPGRTLVVNLRRDPFDVYIGRAGHGHYGTFGNPHPVTGRCRLCDGRLDSLTCFRRYFEVRVATDAEFRRRVLALKGKRLGCFCAKAGGVTADDLPWRCHGQPIAAWLDGVEMPAAVEARPEPGLLF